MAEIQFHQVSHSFDDRSVINQVSLTLTEPRIGIIGANAGGKSTLARMINGLIIPSEGQVTIDGLDTATAGRDIRQKVGFIFSDAENQIIMPTVVEDVAFTLRRTKLTAKQRHQLVEAQLERFGLAEYRNHPPHLLSSGQKQLLALASVLIGEPEVIVADEPTTLLDRRNSRMVARTLAELPQQLVVITHNLELLKDFDRVILLDRGRVIADAVPQVAQEAYLTLIDA